MTIYVTQDDIDGAGSGIIQSPIARALQRATGTKWRVWNGETAYELLPPYRTLSLPLKVQQMWDAYPDMHEMSPFSFEIEMEEPLYTPLQPVAAKSLGYAA